MRQWEGHCTLEIWIELHEWNEMNGMEWNEIDELLPGGKNITRPVKLRAGKPYLESAVQQFLPFKVRCDQKQMKEANKIKIQCKWQGVLVPVKCRSNRGCEDERANRRLTWNTNSQVRIWSPLQIKWGECWGYFRGFTRPNNNVL